MKELPGTQKVIPWTEAALSSKVEIKYCHAAKPRGSLGRPFLAIMSVPALKTITVFYLDFYVAGTGNILNNITDQAAVLTVNECTILQSVILTATNGLIDRQLVYGRTLVADVSAFCFKCARLIPQVSC